MNNERINYVLNLDEIMKFVFGNSTERNADSDITETYSTDSVGALKLDNRIIREIKTKNDESAEFTLRYDLIKMFITSLLDVPAELDTPNELSLGESLIINTMLNENLLSIIKVDEDGK